MNQPHALRLPTPAGRLLATLCAVLLSAGGCVVPVVRPFGGKTVAEACTLIDDIQGSRVVGVKKGPALDRFVVVTFGVRSAECFDAWAVAGEKKEIAYPGRLTMRWVMLLPYLYPIDYSEVPGAVVVAAGHWPAVLLNDYLNTPSSIRCELTLPEEGGYWAGIHACLLPETVPFGPAVSDRAQLQSAGGSPTTPPYLPLLLAREGPGSFLAVVAASKRLTDADRRMIYRQFLLLLEAALPEEEDSQTRASLSALAARLRKLVAGSP